MNTINEDQTRKCHDLIKRLLELKKQESGIIAELFKLRHEEGIEPRLLNVISEMLGLGSDETLQQLSN